MKRFVVGFILLVSSAGLYCPDKPPKQKASKVKKGKQPEESKWWEIASNLGTPWMPFFVQTAQRRR